MAKYPGTSRFARFILTLIGIVVIIILSISTLSFLRERENNKQFSLEKLHEIGEELTAEVEGESHDLAAKLLKTEELTALSNQISYGASDDDLYRNKLVDIFSKYPIADQFFLLSGRELSFPTIKGGKTFSPLSLINSKSPQEERDFLALYREAETRSNRGDYDRATELLEKCAGIPVSDELKARSLDLLARVYMAAKLPTSAVRIWNRLEDKYPNCLNEYHVPYILVAAIEIDGLDAGTNTDRRDSLRKLYVDLLQGRWYLSEEVILELKERLEKRLGYATPKIDRSPILDWFQTAKIVEKELKIPADVEPGTVQTLSISNDSNNVQLYYLILQEQNRTLTLAISANLKWVEGALLDRCIEKMHSNFKSISDFHIRPIDSDSKADLVIPFKNSYTFLELSLPEGSIASAQQSYEIQLIVIVASAAMMIALLVIIAVFIMRITRERMSLELRSQFLSHVSHELKTPLTLIQLYTETLITDETLSEDDRDYSLDVISKESTNLLNLIENLLQFSGRKRTPERFKMSAGDLGAVIEKTVAVYSDWLKKQGIALIYKAADNLPRVSFDREKVTRALLNLIDNARKYGGDSNKIEIILWSENGKVMLEVQDYGPGIPPSERKMIFDEFYRGSNASDRRGVGLGLHLVNETMRAHNGSVELETEIGKGSRFRLIFPAVKTRA